MTKVIALAEIHRTVAPGQPGDKSKGIAPKPPKVQIIPPGTLLETSGDELKELRKLKAVRDIAPDERVSVAVKSDDNDVQVAAKIAAAKAGVSALPGTNAETEAAAAAAAAAADDAAAKKAAEEAAAKKAAEEAAAKKAAEEAAAKKAAEEAAAKKGSAKKATGAKAAGGKTNDEGSSDTENLV